MFLGVLQCWDGKYDFSATRTSFKTIFHVRRISGAVLRHCIKIRHHPIFFPDFFYFFSMYPGIKKNNLKYHVLPDLEVKWQYYHHQIRGKCSPEQVLESPYSAWLANASSSRLTNCS